MALLFMVAEVTAGVTLAVKSPELTTVKAFVTAVEFKGAQA